MASGSPYRDVLYRGERGPVVFWVVRSVAAAGLTRALSAMAAAVPKLSLARGGPRGGAHTHPVPLGSPQKGPHSRDERPASPKSPTSPPSAPDLLAACLLATAAAAAEINDDDEIATVLVLLLVDPLGYCPFCGIICQRGNFSAGF